MARTIIDAIRRLLPIAIVLGLWQLAASLHWIDTAFLPAPVAVARALGDLMSGNEIRDHLLVTLFRALAGLALATVSGVWFGIGMARSWVFNAIVSPLVGASYS